MGGFPKMGSTNFRGLLMPTPKVKKTDITKFKGKNQMAAKKSTPKNTSSKNPSKDYMTGIVWMNIDPSAKKAAKSSSIKKSSKKK